MSYLSVPDCLSSARGARCVAPLRETSFPPHPEDTAMQINESPREKGMLGTEQSHVFQVPPPIIFLPYTDHEGSHIY